MQQRPSSKPIRPRRRDAGARRYEEITQSKKIPRFELPTDRSEIQRWAKDPEFSKYLRKNESRRAMPVPERPESHGTLHFKLLKAQYATRQVSLRLGINAHSMRLAGLAACLVFCFFHFAKSVRDNNRVQALAQHELASISKYITAAHVSTEKPATLYAQVSPAWNKTPYEYKKIEADKIRFWLARHRVSFGFLSFRSSIVAQMSAEEDFIPAPKKNHGS